MTPRGATLGASRLRGAILRARSHSAGRLGAGRSSALASVRRGCRPDRCRG